MMGLQNRQKELFGYNIDLDRRVRADNPLRRVAALIDFSFARLEVEHTYGQNGNVFRQQAAKLTETGESPAPTGPVNQTHVSSTDPDAELARGRNTPSRLCYKHHRAVDNAHGVITAQVTTAGSVKEDTQMFGLIEQHQNHTSVAVQTVVADTQYGTVQNFLKCVDRGIRPHMADLKEANDRGSRRSEFFGEERFIYDARTDTYRCPAGQHLRRWQKRAAKNAYRYMAKPGICASCALRAQCTKAKAGRRVQRFDRQEELQRARAQSQSPAAVRDRHRRKHLLEGSFADASNNHGFKRSRWCGLWRQAIQNHLIAACQNIRILLRQVWRGLGAALAMFAVSRRMDKNESLFAK